MDTDSRTLALLQMLGLTMYDAKAYATLIGLGSTTPFILAEQAGIPRTKIYETLKRLEKDGWIAVERGRPGKVSPRCPAESIGGRKSALDADLKKMENDFTLHYEKRTEQESPNTALIRGIDNIMSRTVDMMTRARASLYLFGTLYYAEEIETIRQQVAAAKRRGVTIRISSGNPVNLKENRVDILGAFSGVTKDVQLAPEPYIRTLTIDNREMLMMFPRPESDYANRDDLIAIWIGNESVTKAINNAFNITWGNPKWSWTGNGRVQDQ